MSQRWLVFTALALGCAPSTRPRPSIDPVRLQPALESQFARSAAAWNRGDLDAFMSDYARDSLTSFMSGGHLHRGDDFIRSHYAPLFGPGANRDSLRFEEFQVRPITGDFALVTARYILYRNGEISASGPFTLLMQHRPEGWKILHDHSSSD
ncbi:MAG: nuclear transport factor 2 family protein [Gemmatimonadota bacterium]